MTDNEADVLIVGAGMAGLMAGQMLALRGLKPLLLDKGRSVGGRLATRRMGGGAADHGAQFFTVRDMMFGAQVERWQREGLVFEWSRGWTDGSMIRHDDGHPRYAVNGGMNQLAKRLSEGQQVVTGCKLSAVRQDGTGWLVVDEHGATYGGRALLLTAPVPQSLALLDAGETRLAGNDRAALEQVTYAACLAGLFHLEDESGLPEPGGVQEHDALLSWLADNRLKGISPEAAVVTAHVNPQMSGEWYARPDADILADIEAELRARLPEPVTILEGQLKRWRYALPTRLHPEAALLASGLAPLAFAGDAFRQARVEGAALSGLKAAGILAESLLA